jgi:peptide deformylase
MSSGIGLVSRPCLVVAAATRALRPAARGAARGHAGSAAESASRRGATAPATSGRSRGASLTAGAKKGSFMAEMEEMKEEEGSAVEFTLPLAIQKYPHVSLRNKNAIVGVFDEELARLSEAMFKLMYDTDGVGLAAPQVGVNYRMMVYNEAGEPGKGKEVTLVNPKIVKFAKQKDLFEEGCLSFPKIYAEVEVRRPKTTPERFTPRPRAFLFPPLRTERKPVSAYNKYTLIPAALVVGCRKAMSKPHARLPPVQMTRGSRSRDVSPDPTPQTLNLLLDPLFPFSDRWACRSRRRTCAGRSSR